ncbi:MAG: porin family protein [Sulfuricurvum sp.]|uniref:porin family protein n=1 Tax=Sulfuricurvum sp. TaxID=2025608 RepID=UPI00260DF61C|nr:porin family protein [Sulfuricurvum sp.]MDD2830466.1 porin family protein [Sulfuricurvum sp.]MDD4948373.1 porin family protein [Sulfuricurvum sp.]
MKKIVSGIVLLTSVLAFAGENSSGFYVGAGVGNTSYSDDGFTKALDVTSKANTDDSGTIGYLGYQFNNIVGIEASYIDYGKFANGSNGFSQEPKNMNFAANVGYSFLDGQLRPYVVAGLGYLKANWKNLPYYASKLSDSAVSFHYGLGLQYEPDFLHGLGVRVAYVADAYVASLDTGSTSETYTQVLGLGYIGLQYKF